MNSKSGPVINLYNAAKVTMRTPGDQDVHIAIETDYPRSGEIVVKVDPDSPERFVVRLRIPAWSARTSLRVNGTPILTASGTYAEVERQWNKTDRIDLRLDMRCRIIDSPHGSDRGGDNRVALVRGPVVLARDENIDPAFDQQVAIEAKDGFVEVTPVEPMQKTTHLQFGVPTVSGGSIEVVDYASVNSWHGKRVCTWMPRLP
jgi:DUF1680 family protein